MRIIPVLDLKGGEVVRAAKGERHRYRPIVTPLSLSAGPVDVANGLRSLHPFSTFYIADLDAIEGRTPNAEAIARLRAMPDAPELWVDAGIADDNALLAALEQPGLRPVLGCESQRDDALLRRFGHHPRLLLSLDFFAEGFRGPGSFLDEHALWPDSVIVMTLARVGSAAGPDFARLEQVKAKAGNHQVIAAGGVRDGADIAALAATGVSAVLVATALHDGTLTAAEITALTA